MCVMPPSRCLALAMTAALSATACAKAPTTGKGENEAAISENTAESRTLDGYTYTTKPVEARIGPHRFAFPANYYDDQIGPAIGGGVGLTLMWPSLQAAPPGTRPTRSMADHYRAISVSIDYVRKVPISGLLQRMASNEATTEDGAIERTDPDGGWIYGLPVLRSSASSHTLLMRRKWTPTPRHIRSNVVRRQREIRGRKRSGMSPAPGMRS